MIEKIVLIGSGNLATQLASAFFENKVHIAQVYSQREESALALARKVNAKATNNLEEITQDTDLYIIAVKDSVIEEVMEKIRLPHDRLIVHTSGSMPMKILDGFSDHFGVFYPVQTFSKNRPVSFENIPVCIEANHPYALLELEQLGKRISKNVVQIDSEERKTLHLAAVFVNNFANHMFAIGADILNERKLDFDLLKPLIAETAAKVQKMHPIDAQTGPAKRYDQNIINAHLTMLNKKTEYQKIYSFVTDSIFHFQQKHDQ
jgi:predicted short-subunit dehydrogenase-like oxidoreductase (DUF2520 family)